MDEGSPTLNKQTVVSGKGSTHKKGKNTLTTKTGTESSTSTVHKPLKKMLLSTACKGSSKKKAKNEGPLKGGLPIDIIQPLGKRYQPPNKENDISPTSE